MESCHSTTPSGNFKEFVREVFFNVFEYTVTVVISDDIRAARDSRNAALGRPSITDACAAFHEPIQGRACSFVFLPFNAGSGTISHECSHAIWRMFRWLGAEMEDEMFAYHLDYLVQQAVAIYGENHIGDVVMVKE